MKPIPVVEFEHQVQSLRDELRSASLGLRLSTRRFGRIWPEPEASIASAPLHREYNEWAGGQDARYEADVPTILIVMGAHGVLALTPLALFHTGRVLAALAPTGRAAHLVRGEVREVWATRDVGWRYLSYKKEQTGRILTPELVPFLCQVSQQLDALRALELVRGERREGYAEGFAEGMADGLVLGAEAADAAPRCADCGADVPPGHGLMFTGGDLVSFCQRCIAKRLTGCFPKP